MNNWINPLLTVIEKYLSFFVVLLFSLLSTSSFLLFTYNRSFLVHQERLETILNFNHQNGILCSKVHVGHDGTTLEFGGIPKVDHPVRLEEATPLPNDDFSLFVLFAFLVLIILLLSIYILYKNKKNDKKETS